MYYILVFIIIFPKSKKNVAENTQIIQGSWCILTKTILFIFCKSRGDRMTKTAWPWRLKL